MGKGIVSDFRMEPSVAIGRLVHRRHGPRRHHFSYAQSMALLNLDELPDSLVQPGWRQRIFRAGLCLRRSDYLHPHEIPMAEAVRNEVLRQSGINIDGKIFFLGHLRQWGKCFNPVVFYFCHNADGRLRAIMAEINNTPWDERHRYVLVPENSDHSCKSHKFSFSKAFHVSPFMPMELNYEWTFTFYRSRLGIFMTLNRAGERVFDASLGLQMKPVSQLGQMPWRHPLQCQRVIFGIYWQALVLWIKRLRVFPHPQKAQQASQTGPGGE